VLAAHLAFSAGAEGVRFAAPSVSTTCSEKRPGGQIAACPCFGPVHTGSLPSGAIWSTDRVCCVGLRGGQTPPFSGGWHTRDRVPDRSIQAIDSSHRETSPRCIHRVSDPHGRRITTVDGRACSRTTNTGSRSPHAALLEPLGPQHAIYLRRRQDSNL